MKHLALAAALAVLPALAWGQTYPFPNAPYAGEKGTGAPSISDQILVQQGVTSHDPVGSPARMTLGTLQSLIGTAFTGGNIANPITVPGVTNSGSETVAGTLGVTGAVGTTSPLGYQQNGATILNVLNGTPYQEGVFIGPRAGAAAPNVISFGMVGIGPDALRSVTRSDAEIVAVGPYACEFVTNGFANTCVGEHTIGFDNPSYTTAIGNDVMRDTIGVTDSTVIGAGSNTDGTGVSNTVVGALALPGNAGSIQVGGTITAGDVLSIAFTTTNANVVGLPATASYTVVGGDTISTIASGLASAIGALNVTYTLPDGQTTLVENGVKLSASTFLPAGALRLHFPGSSTVGWAITPATSCAGTCTETMAVNGEFSGADNIAVGFRTLGGYTTTTSSWNIGIGDYTMQNLAGTAGKNVCIGHSCGPVFSSTHDTVAIGYNAALVETSGAFNSFLGSGTGTGLTTGSNDTLLGAQPTGGSCITTGSLNLEVGTDACVPSPTTNNQVSIQNIIYATGASGRNTTISPGRIGIGTKTPNAALTIGSAGGGADDGHLGFLGTAPALTACGTTPAIDATASDGAGTITEGTTATGCVATFAVAYSTAPHCVVSSPNGAAFTGYSTSTAALTITNASASGNKYSYVCAQ